MKRNTTRIVLAALLLAATATATQAQDAPPPLPHPPGLLSLDYLTNLPTAATLTGAKFAVGTGATIKDNGVENSVKVDVYVRTNWMLSAEIQNGSATVVDSLSLYAGYRKAWAAAEVYVQAGARRTWTTSAGTRPSYQGVGLLGASWLPMTGGKFLLGAEARLLTSPTGSTLNERPSAELVLFTKLPF